MIEKTFAKTPSGVAVRLTGDVGKAAVEAMASQCSTGTCECQCGSGLKEQVKAVTVSGRDGDVTVSLEGEGLEPDALSAAMKDCPVELTR